MSADPWAFGVVLALLGFLAAYAVTLRPGYDLRYGTGTARRGRLVAITGAAMASFLLVVMVVVHVATGGGA